MRSTLLCALILKCETPRQVADWYRDVLELPLEEREQGFSCIFGQTHFAIHGLQNGQSSTRDVEVGIYVPNVDDFVEKLAKKKIELADPVRDYPWARSAQIRDPLGNVIYLMQVPKSSIEELRRNLARELSV